MTVYITTRPGDVDGGPVYHLSRDCHHFPNHYSKRAKSQAEDQGYRPCSFCTGERKSPKEQDFSHYRALKRAARERSD